eukprot:1192788-Prorocentrum_minimum.AAC.1
MVDQSDAGSVGTCQLDCRQSKPRPSLSVLPGRPRLVHHSGNRLRPRPRQHCEEESRASRVAPQRCPRGDLAAPLRSIALCIGRSEEDAAGPQP